MFGIEPFTAIVAPGSAAEVVLLTVAAFFARRQRLAKAAGFQQQAPATGPQQTFSDPATRVNIVVVDDPTDLGETIVALDPYLSCVKLACVTKIGSRVGASSRRLQTPTAKERKPSKWNHAADLES